MKNSEMVAKKVRGQGAFYQTVAECPTCKWINTLTLAEEKRDSMECHKCKAKFTMVEGE